MNIPSVGPSQDAASGGSDRAPSGVEVYWQRQKALGLSDRELARRADLSPMMVSYLKRGKRRLTPEVEDSLVLVLGVDARAQGTPHRRQALLLLFIALVVTGLGALAFRWFLVNEFSPTASLQKYIATIVAVACFVAAGAVYLRRVMRV